MVNSGYVKKTNENGTAVVVFKRESACGGNCASCSGCAASEIEAVALNQVGAVQGDYVTVESETKSVLFSAFVLYILPVLIFITAYLVFEKFGNSIALLSAVLCFFLSFVFAKIRGRKIDGNIKITEIINRR